MVCGEKLTHNGCQTKEYMENQEPVESAEGPPSRGTKQPPRRSPSKHASQTKLMKQNKDPHDSSELRYQLHNQALDLLEAGNLAQAMAILRHLLRLDPKDPHVDHIKGFLLSESGLQDQAIPLLRRAARLLPTRTVPQVTLGIALMRQGALAEAETTLEKALAIDPGCFFSLTNLAACLLAREKSPERAERLLRKADLLMPNDQCVWTNLGRARSLQGKHAKADAALRHAVDIDPDAGVVALITDFYPHLGNGEPPTPPDDPSLNH